MKVIDLNEINKIIYYKYILSFKILDKIGVKHSRMVFIGDPQKILGVNLSFFWWYFKFVASIVSHLRPCTINRDSNDTEVNNVILSYFCI